MATNSSILVWRIPWTEKPQGRKESDTTEVTEHACKEVMCSLNGYKRDAVNQEVDFLNVGKNCSPYLIFCSPSPLNRKQHPVLGAGMESFLLPGYQSFFLRSLLALLHPNCLHFAANTCLPLCLYICFCFSLEFTFQIYLLSKFILQNFSENSFWEAFFGHLRQLNVSSSDLPLGDNFCFMAG